MFGGKNKIKSVGALEVLDSRGNPTIRVEIKLCNGVKAQASVPSGASTGTYEALELRDNDKKRYGGKGVSKAVNNVDRIIAPKLIGKNPFKLRKLDELMIRLDGTKNKSKLGANAILGVSLALAKVGAEATKVPLYRYLRLAYGLNFNNYRLPYPTMNILNGGAHADWSLDIQEFMIVPQQKSFKERVRCGSEVFAVLGTLLKGQGYQILKGDEGGYAPKLPGNETALGLIMDAIKKAGYQAGINVKLALDLAASELYDKKMKSYHLKADQKFLSASEMIVLEKNWVEKYPIILLEDGLAEDDWQNWAELTKQLGKKISLVGDDLFVTNVERLKKGIEMKVANAILIKFNQIGSLSETIDAIRLAQRNGYKVIISHRSGETADTFIADLAVAVNAEFIKTGSLSRSERVEKYNRLLEIENELTK
jgi:enolase